MTTQLPFGNLEPATAEDRVANVLEQRGAPGVLLQFRESARNTPQVGVHVLLVFEDLVQILASGPLATGDVVVVGLSLFVAERHGGIARPFPPQQSLLRLDVDEVTGLDVLRQRRQLPEDDRHRKVLRRTPQQVHRQHIAMLVRLDNVDIAVAGVRIRGQRAGLRLPTVRRGICHDFTRILRGERIACRLRPHSRLCRPAACDLGTTHSGRPAQRVIHSVEHARPRDHGQAGPDATHNDSPATLRRSLQTA